MPPVNRLKQVISKSDRKLRPLPSRSRIVDRDLELIEELIELENPISNNSIPSEFTASFNHGNLKNLQKYN
jgi:hypothetical protein